MCPKGGVYVLGHTSTNSRWPDDSAMRSCIRYGLGAEYCITEPDRLNSGVEALTHQLVRRLAVNGITGRQENKKSFADHDICETGIKYRRESRQRPTVGSRNPGQAEN
jgi:hypothetical protein